MGGSRAEAVPPNKFKRFLTIWGPLSKGGHYPRVATIELLSKALFGSTIQEATCRFSSPEEPKPTTKDLGEGVVDLKFFRALEGEVKNGGGGSQEWRSLLRQVSE